MLLRIPALILLAIVIIIIIGLVIMVLGFGLFRAAEKEMAEKVVSEKETDRRSPESDLKKDKHEKGKVG